MKKNCQISLLFFVFFHLCFNILLHAQQSLLINLGSNTCADPLQPSFSIIKNPLGVSTLVNNCDLSNQIPDYNNTFIAYNPKDNKIYVNDVRYSDGSKIWILDVGLPNSIACPAVIPVAPTFYPTYSTNNFEFDNSGDLWSLRNYNSTTGICIMDKYDILTGNILATKTLVFPSGNSPTDIGNGDLCILPNGRLFATFGKNPSRLYEINNYNGGAGNATATFLQTLPSNCYGIAYLNGKIEVTGTNSVNACYYFDYNISDNTLGVKKNFQNGQSPIDNTSISPVVGATKKLTAATKLSANAYQLTYEIYIQNLGNTVLNNINVTENLETVFGVGNISNVSTNFIAGFNTPNLILNPAYNGTTNTSVLSASQILVNQTSATPNYFFKFQVTFTASNLNPNVIYYNSAIATANIGSGDGLINVTDSSNNGASDVVDPNRNGIANELNENVPTPFSFSLVPIKFITNSIVKNNSGASINWTVATPTVNAQKFIIEYSSDGIKWQPVGETFITNATQSNYQFQLQYIPAGTTFYRIKEIDKDGMSTYGTVMGLTDKSNSTCMIFPNPANNYFDIITPQKNTNTSVVELDDAIGRKISTQHISNDIIRIYTNNLPEGIYLAKIKTNENTVVQKIVVKH